MELSKLTEHQRERVGIPLVEYLTNGTLNGVQVPYVVIKGYAGTGKSFVLNSVLNELNYSPSRVAMSAPTHKAVKILKRNSEVPYVFNTIHSLLKLKEKISDTGVRTFEADSFVDSPLDNCKALIIDESSMLPKTLYEKVIEYKLTREDDFRLIFCGDPLQIPPVKEKNSLVFSEENEQHCLTLELPMRQAADSGILSFATDLRRNIDSSKVQLKSYVGKDIAVLEESYFHSNILPRFKEGYEDNQDSIKFLAYTNKQAEEANRVVREFRLGIPNPPFIVEGDFLVADEHITGKSMGKQVILAHNSDEMKVLEVKIEKLEYSWYAYKSSTELANEVFPDTKPVGKALFEGINMSVNTGKVQACIPMTEQLLTYICTVELDSDEIGKKKTVNIKVIHESSADRFNQILKGLGTLAIYAHHRNKAWVEKFKFERSVAKVKHNYALTVHKSQGSSYDTCCIYEDNILRNSDIYERNRIMYVAATRAKQKLYII